MTRLAGIVLCGGASRRMGSDKAWLPIDGEPMLSRIVRVVATVCEPVVVVAGPNQSLPELPSAVQVIRDAEEHFGPIEGLRGGLAATPRDRPVFVCGCDMPFLTAELIRVLFDEFRVRHAVVPVVSGVRQPLAAIYPPAISIGQVRSLQNLLDQLQVIAIHEEKLRHVDPELRAFIQINDPQSYNEAVREM